MPCPCVPLRCVVCPYGWIGAARARRAVPLQVDLGYPATPGLARIMVYPYRVDRGFLGTACRAPTGLLSLFGHGVLCRHDPWQYPSARPPPTPYNR